MVTVCGKLSAGNGDEAFELTFDDAEVEALNLYVTDVGSLLNRSFLRTPQHFHLSMKFTGLQTAEPQSSAESGDFDEEQWAAFLHLFRPLAGLKNDKVMYGFQRVRKLVERRAASHKQLSAFLGHLSQQFQTKRLPFEMGFEIDGKKYDLEHLFDLWMNAMEFHRDADKKAILGQMNHFLPPEQMRTLMAGLALEKLHAMAGLRHLIVTLLAPPGTDAPLSLRSSE